MKENIKELSEQLTENLMVTISNYSELLSKKPLTVKEFSMIIANSLTVTSINIISGIAKIYSEDKSDFDIDGFYESYLSILKNHLYQTIDNEK